MKKYIILLLALCSMSACDYEAVNTNPYGVSDGELGPLKYGARFMNILAIIIIGDLIMRLIGILQIVE